MGFLGCGALCVQRDIATGTWGRRLRSIATPSPVQLAMQRMRPTLAADQASELQRLALSTHQSPQDVVPYVQLGERLKLAGELEAALFLLKQARRLDPKNAHALFMLAEIEVACQRPEHAITLLRRLIALHPDNMAARHRLADTLRENGFAGQALRIYDDLLKRDPGNASAGMWHDELIRRHGSLRGPNAARRWHRAVRSVGVFGYALILALVVLLTCSWKRLPDACWRDNLCIYMLAIMLLHLAHILRVAADPALIGEELDFAFRNQVYLLHGVQSDSYSTTFSSVLLYRLARALPGVPATIHYARVARLWILAGLPLCAALLARRLATQQQRLAGWTAAVLCLTMAPVVWLGILSIDYCLDAVFAFALLLLVDRVQGGARPAVLEGAGLRLRRQPGGGHHQGRPSGRDLSQRPRILSRYSASTSIASVGTSSSSTRSSQPSCTR